MADIFPKQKRSEIMARVRGHGNKATELAMVELLRRHRIIGWRRRAPVFGKPDFVFRKHRLAIFVDGCFWHGCPKHGTHPSSNVSFWAEKLGRNVDRDRLVTRTLKQRGWKVLRIWQHDFARGKENRLVDRIRRVLNAP